MTPADPNRGGRGPRPEAEAGSTAGPDRVARWLFEPFLPPQPFRGMDPRLYAVRSFVGPAETLEAWHVANRWASTDSDAAEVRHHAEAHLRTLSPEAMGIFDAQRQAGATPALAMTMAGVELQTRAVMALLDELEHEAEKGGLDGPGRDEWVEHQVDELTDPLRELEVTDRPALLHACEYRALLAAEDAAGATPVDELADPAGGRHHPALEDLVAEEAGVDLRPGGPTGSPAGDAVALDDWDVFAGPESASLDW